MDSKPDGFEATLAVAQTTPTLDEGSVISSAEPGTAGITGTAVPSDRYALGAMLGRGGMGEVLTAHDRQIHRTVAIKRLRVDATDADVARLFREAKIQGQLDHPAIVPVHELCRDDEGRPYFVMKQLTGRTLAEVLTSTDDALRRKFDRPTLLRAFVDICLAVEFAHTRGVIHRDLKPSNIILGDFGEVYVLDWGIARLFGADCATPVDELGVPDGETMAGSVVGTPGYMSPEQIRGETDLDGRADVFALGCILFEILNRVPLFSRGTAGLAEVLAGTAARPSVIDVPPELDLAYAAATATARQDRIASARELGNQVRRFLDGDRDLVLRRDLARDELARARTVLDSGGDRGDALRAAARALALDPRATEPAQLVGRLMIEPPERMPPEVASELHDQALAVSKAQIRTAAKAVFAYPPIFIGAYFTGVDEPWLLAGGVLLTVAIWFVIRGSLRRPEPSRMFVVAFILNCGVLGLLGVGMSPLLLPPALAVLLVAAFASHPRLASLPLLYACTIAGLGIPTILEVSNVLRRSLVITERSIEIFPIGSGMNPGLAAGLISLFVFGAVVMTGLLVRVQATERDALLERVQLQACSAS